MKNNYQKLSAMWQDMFRNMPDKEEKSVALGIPVQNNKVHITYYSRPYLLDFITGKISSLSENKEIPFYHKMFIYHLFWYSSEFPFAAKEYVPLQDVPSTKVFYAAFQKSIPPLTAHFNGRIDAFCKACESLGGIKLPFGDAGYSIPIWGNLYLQIILWDGDEEFPASATILFDKNICQFTHPETVVTIGDDGIRAILNADI